MSPLDFLDQFYHNQSLVSDTETTLFQKYMHAYHTFLTVFKYKKIG